MTAACLEKATAAAVVSVVPGEVVGSKSQTLADFEGFLLWRASVVLEHLQKLASDPLVVAQGKEFLTVCHQHDDLLAALHLVRNFRDGVAL